MSELREMYLSEILTIMAEVPGDRAEAFADCVRMAKDLESRLSVQKALTAAECSAMAAKRYPAFSGMTMRGRAELDNLRTGYEHALFEHQHTIYSPAPVSVDAIMKVVEPCVMWDGTDVGGDGEEACRTALNELINPKP